MDDPKNRFYLKVCKEMAVIYEAVLKINYFVRYIFLNEK